MNEPGGRPERKRGYTRARALNGRLVQTTKYVSERVIGTDDQIRARVIGTDDPKDMRARV